MISKRLIILILVWLFAMATSVQAQYITNYAFTTSTVTFTALSSPTYPTFTAGNTDDGYFNNIPIGFDFWYMGTPYTTISASTNGWLTLGADITNSTLTNSLSNGGAPRPVIAPLWDDISVQATSNVSYKITGSAPNRVFTIQYLNTKWRYNASGNTITFQVMLYESTGKIEFIYRPETGALVSPSASIGITTAASGSGNFLSVNNAGTSVSSTTEASVTSKPASGKKYTFTPLVPNTPGSLAFSDVTPTSMTLNWSDLSSNETGFYIYGSTDAVNYSLMSQTLAGATSSVQSDLIAATTYYWKIYAVAEGGMSTALSGSQATTANLLGWYNASWLYRKAITIDYTKVAAGPHTNFPILISRVDADLQTKAQTDADDILFTSSDGTTKLSHEIESYTGASGTLVAWVEIPDLSSSANTVIYMYYGNATASSQQNITGTWETNFLGVYHLNNSFNDATSNAYNGTNTGTTNVTGQIANGRGYAAGNKVTIAGLMGNPGNVTLSAWVNLTSLSSSGSEVVSLGDHMALRLASPQDIVSFSYNGSGWNNTVGVYGVTGWHYIATTFDDAGNSQNNYLDGLLVTPTSGGSFTPSITYTGLGANTIIGNHGNNGSNFTFLGTLDEVRVTGTNRSTGWLWTEYNNQSSPSTFYNVGSEVNSGAKIFTGTGNFSTAARWTGGTLPVAGENIIIDGTCTVDNYAGTDNLAYGILTIGTATGRTLNWAAGGTNRLNVTNVIAGAGAGTLDMTNGGTMIIRGSWASTNLTFTPGAGTIEMQSTISLPAAYITYNNLTVNGTGITVSLAAATTVTGNLVITAGTLNANNADLTVGNNWTNNASTTAFTAGTATVMFNSASAQAIGGTFATTFNNLTIAKTAGTVSLNTNVSLIGNISVASGTFDLAVFSANRNSAGGTLNVADNAILKIGGINSYPVNFTTNTLGVASTVEYSGTTQTVKGLTYGNLTISGAGTNSKTADNNITVNGVLNLGSANASATQGCLEMGTFTLTMGADATTTGIGDVTGIIKRTTLLPGVIYTFGNYYTTATFPNVGTLPTEMSAKISIGTAPSWRPGAIKREVEVIQTGGSGTKALFASHYLDTELNGNVEENLVMWIGLPTNLEYGRSAYNTAENWVALSNIDVAFFLSGWSATRNFALDEYGTETTLTWNGSVSTSWTAVENWTPNVGPSSNKNIVIPDASTTPNDPILPFVTEIKSLTIAAGGILNSDVATLLTINGINGAWSNFGGTFYPNTSNVIFTDPYATISGTTNFYDVTIPDGGGLVPSTDNIMRIANALTVVGTGVLRAAFLPNTIEFNGADQNIINPTGLTPGYYNLILSGTGTKTMPGTALSIAGDFSMAGSASATAGAALLVGGNVTIGSGNALNMGSFSHTIAGNLTNNGGTLTSSASSITFNGSGLQTITATGFAVDNLTISNTSVNVTLGTSTNCSIGGNLTVDADAVFNLATNSLTAVTGSVANSGTIITQSTSTTPVPTGKTWGGSFEFTGTGGQTIVAGTYNNLTMSGSGGATANANISVDGILNLSSANPSSTKGILDMGSKTLLMGSASTTIGQGDVTGIIKRTSFIANTPYTFGNQFTTATLSTGGTYPSEIQFKVSIGTSPSWKTTAINRIYEWIQTGGSGASATLSVHYLDSELNGNNENTMVVWGNGTSLPLIGVAELGRSGSNSTDNWVALSFANIEFVSTGFGALEHTFANSELASYTWAGTQSTSWIDPVNWAPLGTPSSVSNIIIPDAATTSFDPIIPVISACKTITLESGAILNANVGTQFTIAGEAGAWNNQGGMFNPNTSTIVFENSGATMTGTSDFNNLTIDTTATLVLQENTYLGITGTLVNNGTLGTVENGVTTVEYKGGDQTVVVPSANSYSTLILSGSGTKTMPTTALNIEGNFTLTDTVTTTAGAPITLGGDLTIGSGSAFITGTFNHSIGGNFGNNGTFTAAAGNTISMNGTSSQSIQGSVTTGFDNLTINNNNIVSLFDSIIVNNALTLTSGNLSVGGTTLGINGTISKTSGYIEVVPQSSLIFEGTGAITLNNNLFSTPPSINDLTINRAGGVSLGNQNMTVNGLLDLQSGTLNLVANTLTIAGSSPTRTSGYIDAGNAGATLSFTNDTAIILPASIFTGDVNNLTINGTGGITASSDFTVNGVLNLQSANPSDTTGSLDMWDGTVMKTLTMDENATTVGSGDVTGIIKRTSFIANTPYTFGNQFTTITLSSGGTYPTQILLKISIGASPSWKLTAINRIYEYIQIGGSNCFATISTHYLDTELNGNDENALVMWGNGTPGPILGVNEFGRSNSNSLDNWIAIANINLGYFPTGFGQFENTFANSELASYTWNGSQSTSWIDPDNWTPVGTPSSVSNIIIPDVATTLFSPTLPASTEIKAITIEVAAILNAVASEQFTINGDNGAWSNTDGTFNPGTSNVIFTNAAATISGTTDFYDVTINSNAALSMTAGSIMGIAGTMTNNGTWHTVTGGITIVDYNGGDQNVVVPNTLTNRYNTLILSGSGVKTMPATALDIYADFTMSGTATATLDAAMTVAGNLTIESGNTLSVSPVSYLIVSGTLTNNAYNAGLVLQSDATGTASLIHNTGNVTATVQRFISGDAEAWHFLSSPVYDQPISGSWLPSGTYGNGTGYDLYLWNESNSCWIYQLDITSPVNWSTVHPGSNFAVGRGYLYSVQATNPTKEFVGKLNNGPLDFGLAFSGTDASLKGFNLTGNPYPSAIDWGAASGWTRTNLNSSGGGYDMWIWNPTANNYGVYNSADADGTGTNSVTRNIAPMQGYFVQAASAGNLGVNNEVRVFNGAGNWLKSTKQKVSKVSLSIRSDAGYGSDEIQLRFGYPQNENGAMKLFSKVLSAPSLYMASEGDYLSVLNLTNTEENTAVPFRFTPGMNGKYTITCNFDQVIFETVMLEDQQMHYIQNMKTENTYHFNALKTDKANRFVLHFEPVDNQVVNEFPANIYTNGNRLIIDLTLIGKETDAFVYDIMGRLLFQQKLHGEISHELSINTYPQILVIHLRNPDGSLSQKLLWTGN